MMHIFFDFQGSCSVVADQSGGIKSATRKWLRELRGTMSKCKISVAPFITEGHLPEVWFTALFW